MQVGNLSRRRIQFLGPGKPLTIEPEGMEAMVPGRLDVVEGVIADMQGLVRRQTRPVKRRLEQGGVRSGRAHLTRGQGQAEKATQGSFRRIRIAVGHGNQLEIRGQDAQDRDDIGIRVDLVAVRHKQVHSLRRQGRVVAKILQQQLQGGAAHQSDVVGDSWPLGHQVPPMGPKITKRHGLG